MQLTRNKVILIVLVTLLSGCAGAHRVDDEGYRNNDWLHTVIGYRQALNDKPDSVERKLKLAQAELEAADFYYKEGMAFYKKGSLDLAITEFQKGLTVKANDEKLRKALGVTVARQEAQKLYVEAESLRVAGRLKDAETLYKKSLNIYPEHQRSMQQLQNLRATIKHKEGSNKWAMDSTSTITLRFRGTDLRTAFEFIAKSFKVNVIFDEAVKNIPVTIFARNVTFKQAISLLTTTTKTFYKRIAANTIIVASDKKDKRGQYEDHITRAFLLKSIQAKDMKDILKSILSLHKIAINESLNTIIVRDKEDVLSLVEKLIVNNDRKPAEMILDVEILEVSRTKADKLGLDLGTYEVSENIPTSTQIPFFGGVASAVKDAAQLTLPSVTLRFLKQEIDAKTLANPRIRVVNRETANIHIGDRVPLQASRIVDATGQVRTTFDYRDIGIRLKMMPIINLDHTVAIKLDLEVSSLGENLGSPNEPAFKIGTRNASTIMVLRDGETAILGGLIRDDERTTESTLPLLGSIPFLGRLFTSSDKSGGRTDILLTISPRIIRGHDLAPKGDRAFYSGTEKNYLDRAVFSYGNKTLGMQGVSAAFVSPVYAENNLQPQRENPFNSIEQVTQPEMGFDKASYITKVDGNIEVTAKFSALSINGRFAVDLLYNPNLLEYIEGASSAQELSVNAEQAIGVVHLVIEKAEQLDSITSKLSFKAKKQGISYLVYKSVSSDGNIISAVKQTSKVVVNSD